MSSRTSIGGLISRAAKRNPGKTFYISTDSERALAYGRLEQRCGSLGRQFSALGLQRGDKVSVYMPNCEHTALPLLGIMASGLVADPINLVSPNFPARKRAGWGK